MSLRRTHIALLVFVLLAAMVPDMIHVARAGSGDTLAGRVFRDIDFSGDQNGLEAGEVGVTVTVTDALGTAASTVSGAGGDWTLALDDLDAGPYRVEFSGWGSFLHSGPIKPAPSGTVVNGGAVQFGPSGDVRIDLGLVNPAHYCDSAAEVVTTCFLGGDATIGGPAVISMTASSGTTSPASNDGTQDTPYTEQANMSVVGPVKGLAHSQNLQVVFAGAHTKRHTAFPNGPDDVGPDRIWVMDTTTGSGARVFYTAEAGDDAHDYTNLLVDETVWDAVGRTGWGDLELSEDETVLYAVNLFDRSIHVIPLVTAGDTVSAGAATTLPFASADTDCSNGDWVPGGLLAHDGTLYASVTCTAQTSGLRSDLEGFIYAIDGAGASTQKATFGLDYTGRGKAGSALSIPANGSDFLPWVPAVSDIDPGVNGSLYPQPWIMDMEILTNGEMVVGVADRGGDQFGNDPQNTPGGGKGISVGDTLRLTSNLDGTWSAPGDVDSFYDSERYPLAGAIIHAETSLGSIGYLHGSSEIVINAYDPPPVQGEVWNAGHTVKLSNQSWESGGFISMSTVDGSRQRSTTLFLIDEPRTFGKTAGVGDIELACDAAPIQIGDFVWIDADADGIQDPSEAGVDGVSVELWKDGSLVDTTTTANGGEYLFDDLLPQMDYEVRIPASQTGAGEALDGYRATTADAGADGIDSDGMTTLDGQIALITTGVAGDNDHTIDFGYVVTGPMSLGDLVFNDTNNNGMKDVTESGIDGVVVDLYLDSAGDGVDVDLETPIATDTTDGGGLYLFTGLDADTYVVVIRASNFDTGEILDGWISSTGNDPAPDPDTDVGDDDNGPDATAGGIASAPVTLTENGEPDTDVDGDDTDGNLTVDFGVWQPAAIGDRVFFDTDGDGIQDDGEVGVAEVTVTLLDEDLVEYASTTTDEDGDYLFDGLTPGDWTVVFTAPDGTDLTLQGEGTDPALDSDADPQTGRTAVVNLSPGERDLTVDAGLVTEPGVLSLGNLVWDDVNNDGVRDVGEPGVQGVVVDLSLDGTVIATTTTDADGLYLFSELDPGDYVVIIRGDNFATGEVLDGWESSTGGDPATDPDDDVDDDDNGPDATADGIASLPVTLTVGGEPTSEDGDANSNLTVDFGVWRPAAIGDRVFDDTNADGIQDAGEDGVADVVVVLLDENLDEVATTTTDANGDYLFDDLVPGDYTVEFTPPPGSNLTQQGAGTDPALDSDADSTTGRTDPITLDAGERDLTVDAGIVPVPGVVSVGDRVWLDLNRDGVQDDGEPGVAGVTVMLFDAADPTTSIGTTATDTDGRYVFTDLPAASYLVKFTPPTGYVITTQDAGADDAADSDADPDTGLTSATGPLALGEQDLTLDAGMWQPVSLGDTVFWDLDRDGVQDDGEPGAEGVLVWLLDGDGNPIEVASEGGVIDLGTVTDANGSYSFTGLPPGDYIVMFDPSPIGAALTTQDAGTDDTVDSDADPTTGRTAATSLEGGDHDPTLDAGLLPASIGDTVFLDEDGDGIQDDGEPGVPDVPVTLIDGDGDVIDTTVTDEDGKYIFDGLLPGDYIVEIDPPSDMIISPPDQGGDDDLDSDADPTSGRTPVVQIGEPADITNVDFGLIPVPNLVLTKNLADDVLVAGAEAVYQIVITNDSRFPTSGPVTVVDNLPSALAYVRTETLDWLCALDGTAVRCVFDEVIGAGTSVTLRIVTLVDPSAIGDIANTATVTVSGVESETADNEDDAVGTVEPAPSGELPATGSPAQHLAVLAAAMLAAGAWLLGDRGGEAEG